MDSLYLVMPAYNEEENIEEVVRAWYPILSDKGEDSRMVIADSGSSDGTHGILERLQKEFPKLEILSNTGKQHGPKVIALYKYAIERGADYIFQTDSDGQTNPAEFAGFWKLRERYAGIFGFRKDRGDGKIRAFVEKVVCLLLNLYFHVSVPDANAPFRLMRAEVVAKYLPRMNPDYNLPNIMMTTFFSYYGERIRFRKITFRPRQAGVNSVNVRKIVGIGFKALGDFRAFKKAMLNDEEPGTETTAWNPDAPTELPDDIPDMPKTVYVMNGPDAVTAESASTPETESNSDTPEMESESTAPETKPESTAPEAKPETESESAAPEVKQETEADTKPEESETPEPVTDSKSDMTEAVTEVTPETETKSDTPETETESADTEPVPEPRTDSKPETPETKES